MKTTRRRFAASLTAVVCGVVAVLNPRPLFATHVRDSRRKWNRSRGEHTEYGLAMPMPYTAIEDAEQFHELAERVRLSMIHALRQRNAPINVWRCGQVIGEPASNVDHRTGLMVPWTDEHRFRMRCRVSTETPPFTYEG